MVDEDEDVVMNTHRNARAGFGTVERPPNYPQMRLMMGRIVSEMRAEGITNPSNEDVMREYSMRMKKFRSG